MPCRRRRLCRAAEKPITNSEHLEPNCSELKNLSRRPRKNARPQCVRQRPSCPMISVRRGRRRARLRDHVVRRSPAPDDGREAYGRIENGATGSDSCKSNPRAVDFP